MFIFRHELWTAIPGKSMVLRNFPISIALNVPLLLKKRVSFKIMQWKIILGKNLEESDITNIVKIEMSDTEGDAGFNFDETKISKVKKLENVEVLLKRTNNIIFT